MTRPSRLTARLIGVTILLSGTALPLLARAGGGRNVGGSSSWLRSSCFTPGTSIGGST